MRIKLKALCMCGLMGLCSSAVGQAAPAGVSVSPEDGAFFIAMYNPTRSAIDFIRVTVDDTATWLGRIGSPSVSGITSVDIDSDGSEEFAVSLTDVPTALILKVGESGVVGGHMIELDEPSIGLVLGSPQSGAAHTFLSLGASGTTIEVLQVGNGPVNSGTACDQYEQCNANCLCTAIEDGIHNCIEAARCRTSNCHWAACVLRESGEYGLVRTVGAHLARAAAYWVDVTACIPSTVVPD